MEKTGIKKILFITILVATLLLVIDQDIFAQCAMCRATVENNLKSGASSVGAGLNTGILYLMAFPYILLSVIAFVWYRNYKKTKGMAHSA